MTKTSSLRSVVPVFVLFLLLLSAVFYYGANGFIKALTAKSWPTTTGTVLSSAEVIKAAGKTLRFGVEIDYSYTVDGQEYHSKYFKVTATRGTPEWAQQTKQYSVNSRVTVYHNPKDPKDSVIEPGPRTDNYVMTFVPLILIAVLIVVLIQQIRKKNRQADNR